MCLERDPLCPPAIGFAGLGLTGPGWGLGRTRFPGSRESVCLMHGAHPHVNLSKERGEARTEMPTDIMHLLGKAGKGKRHWPPPTPDQQAPNEHSGLGNHTHDVTMLW